MRLFHLFYQLEIRCYQFLSLKTLSRSHCEVAIRMWRLRVVTLDGGIRNGNPLDKSSGGGRCANLRAIYEIEKAALVSLRRQLPQTRRPAVEPAGRITGRLGLGAAPQAEIGEISGQLLESWMIVVVDQG